MDISKIHSATFLELLFEYNSIISSINSLENDLENISNEDIVKIVESKIKQLKQDMNTLEHVKLYTQSGIDNMKAWN